MIPFSQRHKKYIESKEAIKSISTIIRNRLLYFIVDKNEDLGYTTDTNWNYSESILVSVYRKYQTIMGLDNRFPEIPNKDEEIVINSELENGNLYFIFDIIEMIFTYKSPESSTVFSADLNLILKTSSMPYRFLDGGFIRIASDFLNDSILDETGGLLASMSYDSALSFYNDARIRLSSGDYPGAIIFANNALESFLKLFLNHPKAQQGTLKKKLISTKVFPKYFEGFINAFETLLQSSFTIANKSSRHGVSVLPSSYDKVDENIATFALHLVGSIILFIADRAYIVAQLNENETKEGSISASQLSVLDDDLPF